MTNNTPGYSGTSRPKVHPSGMPSASSTPASSPSRSPIASSVKSAQTRSDHHTSSRLPSKNIVASKAIESEKLPHKGLERRIIPECLAARVACTYCSFPSRYPHYSLSPSANLDELDRFFVVCYLSILQCHNVIMQSEVSSCFSATPCQFIELRHIDRILPLDRNKTFLAYYVDEEQYSGPRYSSKSSVCP